MAATRSWASGCELAELGPLINLYRVLQGTLEALDRVLFKIPFMKKQAWIVVIELGGPCALNAEKI